MSASRIENSPAVSHPADTELLSEPSRRRALRVIKPMFPLNPWTTQPGVAKRRA